MASWEYRVELLDAGGPHSNPDGTLKNLNKGGNQGWEAVAWLPHSGDKDSGWVLLKKPVRG
jgi:hypothetical protein